MGRRVVAWMVAAVVTVALVAGGVLVARGGLDRSPAVLPVDLGDGGQATATAAARSGDAGAAIEPAPAPGGVAPARPTDLGDLPQPWPRVTYRLKGALPSLPGQARAWKVGDAVDAGRVGELAAALGPGRQAQRGAERLDGPRRPPRPGGAPAGRGALDLRHRHPRRLLVPLGRRLRGRRGRPVPGRRRPRGQPAGGAGQAVAAAGPAEPGRGRAGRPRPGRQGRAGPGRGHGPGHRRLRQSGRHHRPGGGRLAHLGVRLEDQRRRQGRDPARRRAPGHPGAGRHLPADRRGRRLRAAQEGPGDRPPPVGGGGAVHRPRPVPGHQQDPLRRQAAPGAGRDRDRGPPRPPARPGRRQGDPARPPRLPAPRLPVRPGGRLDRRARDPRRARPLPSPDGQRRGAAFGRRSPSDRRSRSTTGG